MYGRDKVNVPNSNIITVIWTPVREWHVVNRCESKNKHQIDLTSLTELGICGQTIRGVDSQHD